MHEAHPIGSTSAGLRAGKPAAPSAPRRSLGLWPCLTLSAAALLALAALDLFAVNPDRPVAVVFPTSAFAWLTPLNAIIGFSELTKEQTFGPPPERCRDYAADIHASGGHLLALINDVLDLSRIESGKHMLFEEQIDIAALMKACVSMMSIRANTSDVRL